MGVKSLRERIKSNRAKEKNIPSITVKKSSLCYIVIITSENFDQH